MDGIVRGWSALPVETIGLLCLLPVAEPVLDLMVFNSLLTQSYFSSAALIVIVLVCHWRMCTLYAALCPRGSYQAALTLYAPFMLLPNWGCIAGDEVSKVDLEGAYSAARQAPRHQSPISFAAPTKEERMPAIPLPLRLPKIKVPSPPPSPPEQESAEDSVAPREQAKVPSLMLASISPGARQQAESKVPDTPGVASGEVKPVASAREKFIDMSKANASPRVAATAANLPPQQATADEANVNVTSSAVAAAAAAGAAAAAVALAAEAKQSRVHAKPRDVPVLATPLRGLARKRNPGTAADSPKYGFEATIIRALVEQNVASFDSLQGDYVRQLFLIVIFEAKLTCLSLVVGPMLLWGAALTLFRGAYLPSNAKAGSYAMLDMITPRYDASLAAEERLMHCRILLIMQAGFQSLPQAAAQTSVFFSCSGGFSIELYLLSMTCSLSVASFALMSFAQHRQSLSKLAFPQADDIAAELARRSEMLAVDSAWLLADIAAAREAGVPHEDTHAAVLRLRDQRVAQARALHQNGCVPQMLFDAGYTPAELCAAGVSAGELRAAGLWLAQLEELGLPLRELRDSGYSTEALHDAGHELHELVAAGATAEELKSLQTFTVADLRGAGLGAAALRAVGYSAEDLKTGGCSGGEMKQAGWTAKELRAAGYSAAELRQGGYAVFELKAAGYTNADLNEDTPGCSSAPNSTTKLLLEGPSAAGSSRTSGFGGPSEKKRITDGKAHGKGHELQVDENYAYTKLPPNFPDDTSTSWLNNRAVPPEEHRPMPPRTPAPIYNSSGQQTNQQYWSNKTMGYVGTNAFAR